MILKKLRKLQRIIFSPYLQLIFIKKQRISTNLGASAVAVDACSCIESLSSPLAF